MNGENIDCKNLSPELTRLKANTKAICLLPSQIARAFIPGWWTHLRNLIGQQMDKKKEKVSSKFLKTLVLVLKYNQSRFS